MNKPLRTLALLAAALMAACTAARAERFPSKPVQLIVGAGPGSYPDQVARRLGDALSAVWGQPVVVENRAGAGGVAAIAQFMKASSDGYTLALATMSQLVFNRYILPSLPYDPATDLVPIGTVLSGSMMVVAHPGFEAQSLGELVDLAQRQPKSLAFAVPASGSPPHVVLAMLMDTTRTSFTVVPFKTGAEAVTQVAAGQVPLFIDAVPVVAGLVQSGKLKALAVTGKQRVAQFPNVPTVAEQGYPDFRGEAWIGLVARSGTPPALVKQLNQDLAQALHAAPLREFLETSGARTLVTTPEEFAALVKSDSAHWGPVIKAIGLSQNP